MAGSVVWCDGALRPAEAPTIRADDRGLTLGDGLFETIRVSAGAAVALDAHLARLAVGARLLDLPLPEAARLADAVAAVIAANTLAEGVVRLTVTRGPGARGIVPPGRPQPTTLASAASGAVPQGPVRLTIAEVTRRNEHSPLSRIKSLNALDAVLARIEAGRRGCDDAVLLNGAGRVAETTVANLFLRIGDTLVTSPIGEGALPGTMRARILAETGAIERPIDIALLETADEIVLTNALSIRAAASLTTPAGERRLGGETAAALRRIFGLPAA